MMASAMRLIMVLGLILGRSDSFPNGAPEKACNTLLPVHPGGSLQNSPTPYRILPAAGQGRVGLILGSDQGLPYEGFIMVARDVQTGDYVGEFVDLPTGTKALECVEGIKVTGCG